MKVFDTHAHLNFESFDLDREDVIAHARESGVIGMINAGCDHKTSAESIALADLYPFIYATVGIHPEYASDTTDEDLKKIKLLALNKKVVAIGEFGLDYHYEPYDKDKQAKIFRAQMEIAQKLKKPVMLHIRDAYEDAYAIMAEYPEVTGVVHCFSAGLDFAQKVNELGYYVAFGGVMTYPAGKQVREVAMRYPLDKIILETDCPFLSPTREKRNTPEGVIQVFEAFCELRNEEPNIIEQQILTNVETLFGIKKLV